MKHLPNFLTSLNLASGFIAIIFAANGDLTTASWLILVAMIFDFLDGFSARILKAYSDIGKELDSLADLVSFGAAPGFIIYRLLSNAMPLLGVYSSGLEAIMLLVIISIPVIMPVCAAIRLAKFNIDPSQATSFRGLPTPANALAVISVVIAANYSDSSIIKSFAGSLIGLDILTVILSILMVSNLQFLSFKIPNFRIKGNEGRYLLALLVLISLAIFGIKAAPLVIPLYIIVSLISLLF